MCSIFYYKFIACDKLILATNLSQSTKKKKLAYELKQANGHTPPPPKIKKYKMKTATQFGLNKCKRLLCESVGTIL